VHHLITSVLFFSQLVLISFTRVHSPVWQSR